MDPDHRRRRTPTSSRGPRRRRSSRHRLEPGLEDVGRWFRCERPCRSRRPQRAEVGPRPLADRCRPRRRRGDPGAREVRRPTATPSCEQLLGRCRSSPPRSAPCLRLPHSVVIAQDRAIRPRAGQRATLATEWLSAVERVRGRRTNRCNCLQCTRMPASVRPGSSSASRTKHLRSPAQPPARGRPVDDPARPAQLGSVRSSRIRGGRSPGVSSQQHSLRGQADRADAREAEAIGDCAASLIQDGEAVLLDSGSTAFGSRGRCGKNFSVMTNDPSRRLADSRASGSSSPSARVGPPRRPAPSRLRRLHVDRPSAPMRSTTTPGSERDVRQVE